MDFELFFSIFVKCFQIASNTSKWVPKHPRDPKACFGSPHAPYGHTKKFLRKSISGLEISFFTLQGRHSLKKRIFEQNSKDKTFFQTSFYGPPR